MIFFRIVKRYAIWQRMTKLIVQVLFQQYMRFSKRFFFDRLLNIEEILPEVLLQTMDVIYK